MDCRPLANSAPPDFLQLAGHPLRWRLLAELARSDRLVHELTGLVGEAQNLVSYHLGKLRDGRLVSARRSAADRRDTYYALDLSRVGHLLSAAGAALHPGLRLAPPAERNVLKRRVRVLFLCTGNSARSQMAEALAKAMSGGAVRAYSAGSQPKPLHPNAVRAMRESYDLDLGRQKSKHLDMFAGKPFDWVISLCDRAREVCPEFSGHPQTVHWSIANPVTGLPDATTYPLFQQTAAELEARIGFLLAVLTDQGNQGEAYGRPQ
jgi:ArsR family transcriptional regulator, arsenate/arsenite/antimonite-responsive transcriptional repressor / arsenate reductase (thioredoxin)